MDKIKKQWKEILIVLLIIFSMNKCTVACNRNGKLNEKNNEIAQKDSIITAQNDSLNILKIRFSDAQTNKNDLVGISLNTKQELIKDVEKLNDANTELNKQIEVLKTENNKIKKENIELRNKLSK